MKYAALLNIQLVVSNIFGWGQRKQCLNGASCHISEV